MSNNSKTKYNKLEESSSSDSESSEAESKKSKSSKDKKQKIDKAINVDKCYWCEKKTKINRIMKLKNSNTVYSFCTECVNDYICHHQDSDDESDSDTTPCEGIKTKYKDNKKECLVCKDKATVKLIK